jgi:hypothetical protein
VTGAEFASAGEHLALAHAAIRPDGAAWLADDPTAADELAEWELEGHPFTNWPPHVAPTPEKPT